MYIAAIKQAWGSIDLIKHIKTSEVVIFNNKEEAERFVEKELKYRKNPNHKGIIFERIEEIPFKKEVE